MIGIFEKIWRWFRRRRPSRFMIVRSKPLIFLTGSGKNKKIPCFRGLFRLRKGFKCPKTRKFGNNSTIGAEYANYESFYAFLKYNIYLCLCPVVLYHCHVVDDGLNDLAGFRIGL